MANETVLVIEDNEMNMKLARSLLQIGNYCILEAIDVEFGIQMAREHHPDLILMDIQLPDMDGLTAIRVIKNDLEVKDITVVALTSYAMEGDEKKAMDVGCAGYIAKPIDTRSFLETLGKF